MRKNLSHHEFLSREEYTLLMLFRAAFEEGKELISWTACCVAADYPRSSNVVPIRRK